MIHMDRNTSPISPLSDEAIAETIKGMKIYEYPSDEIIRFKQLYGQYYNIDPKQLEVANGSDEWIQKTIMTLGRRGVMTLSPDFVMYQEYSDQIDVPVYTIPCDSDFKFDFDQVVEEISSRRPSLFLISVPHNPTGQMFSEDELERLSGAMASVDGYLVLDEAYAEFAPVYKRPPGAHVVIIRTLSKMFGVAGLRIGTAIADGETFEKITRLNHPYPVNSLSLNLANRILEDRVALDEFIEYQEESKARLEAVFNRVKDKVNVLRSHTNFIFTYGTNARDLGQYLQNNGYQPRMYDIDPLNDVVRYSIISIENYDRLNDLINEWSSQYDHKRKSNTGDRDYNISR